jgi:hypothetical protein
MNSTKYFRPNCKGVTSTVLLLTDSQGLLETLPFYSTFYIFPLCQPAGGGPRPLGPHLSSKETVPEKIKPINSFKGTESVNF